MLLLFFLFFYNYFFYTYFNYFFYNNVKNTTLQGKQGMAEQSPNVQKDDGDSTSVYHTRLIDDV